MAEVKSFTFFKSYYDSLEDLDEENRNEILNAILDYVFKNKKPKLSGINKTIWTLIEPNLNTSKNRSNKKSGAPKGNSNALKTSEKTIQSKNNQKTIKKQSNASYSYSYSYSYSFSLLDLIQRSKLKDNTKLIKKFKEYLKLREEKDYTVNEIIIKRLLGKLDSADSDEDRNEMIEQAIIGGWKDFYPVESKAIQRTQKTKKVNDGAYLL